MSFRTGVLIDLVKIGYRSSVTPTISPISASKCLGKVLGAAVADEVLSRNADQV